jgi:hypothetical protein
MTEQQMHEALKGLVAQVQAIQGDLARIDVGGGRGLGQFGGRK